jgi:hypothetical protein
MTQKEAIDKVVFTIKNKRPLVVSFLNKYGKSIKRNDSDVFIGRELSDVLSKNGMKAINEFSSIIDASNADGPTAAATTTSTTTASGAATGAKAGSIIGPIGTVLGGLFGAISGSKASQSSTQQSSDAITLALINAGIQKQKTSTPIVIGMVILAIVVIGITIALILKYKKK